MSAMSTPRVLVLLSGLWLGLAGPNSALSEENVPECPFRGEIFSAESFDDVLLFRGGNRDQRVRVRAHTPLFPGDALLVIGDQRVLIRDEPNGAKRRITSGDGEIVIGKPESCELSRGLSNIFAGVWQVIAPWAEGPVAALPQSTLPRSGAEGKAEELVIALLREQKLSPDIESLTLFWRGSDARMILSRTDSPDSVLDVLSEGRPFVGGDLNRSLVPGEALDLEVISRNDTESFRVRVAEVDALPLPPGVASLSQLSADEKAVYAVWLAVQGPEEWRLQGLSLLAEAATANYMAWKVWRGLISK